jgi:hypothetical protein
MNSKISTAGPTGVPTPIEAERAIYIDFEGTETEPPSFLGAAWAYDDGEFRFVQYVLDPALSSAAKAATGVFGGAVMPADWSDLAELRRIAEAEHRWIIAWSDRERKALADGVLDEGDRRWFKDHMLDAKPLAKRWKRRMRPEVVFRRDPKNRMRGRHRLDRYFGSSATRCRRSSVPATRPNGSGPCAANSRGVATTRR